MRDCFKTANVELRGYEAGLHLGRDKGGMHLPLPGSCPPLELTSQECLTSTSKYGNQFPFIIENDLKKSDLRGCEASRGQALNVTLQNNSHV